MSLDYKLLRKLVDGFVDGDGCEEERRYRLVTTSETLTKQLYLILASIDNVPSVSKIVRDDRLPYYEICVSKNTNKMIHTDDNNIYIPIRKIENIAYKGLVYNIEVEKDNSYIYDIYSVHNCMDYFRETILGDLNKMDVNEFFNSDGWNKWCGQVTGKIESDDKFICKRCLSPGG